MCVIAVVTFLICATVVVNNVFDLANPVQAGFGASAVQLRGLRGGAAAAGVRGGAQARPDTTSEATLRRRYEALRTDHIARVRFQAWKAIVTSGLLLLISVVLFVWHWRWMKRLGAAAEAGTA